MLGIITGNVTEPEYDTGFRESQIEVRPKSGPVPRIPAGVN